MRIIIKSTAHPDRDAGPSKRIPPEPEPEQQETTTKTQRRIPTLMFHYRVFGCLRAVVAGGHYHNLLHSVHKLLHALVPGELV